MIDDADEALAEAFHRGLFLDEFAAQREPFEAWQRALRGEAPYRLTIRVARQAGDIVGGIAYELYPRSHCGLVTYLVVAPGARRGGLGKRLLDDALAALAADGARTVFGEVADAARLDRFQRWGARLVDVPYIQPALGPGLARDAELTLIAFDDRDALPGALVADFVRELYEATEGCAPEIPWNLDRFHRLHAR